MARIESEVLVSEAAGGPTTLTKEGAFQASLDGTAPGPTSVGPPGVGAGRDAYGHTTKHGVLTKSVGTTAEERFRLARLFLDTAEPPTVSREPSACTARVCAASPSRWCC